MTILDRIIKTVQKEGVITLQGIYDALPDIKKDVIRGTINRYVRKKFGKLFERCKRGIYVAIIEVESAVISLESNKMQMKRALLSKLKRYKQSQKINNHLKVVGLNDCDSIVSDIAVPEFEEGFVDDLDIKGVSIAEASDMEMKKKEKGEIAKFLNKVFNEDSKDLFKRIPSESIDLVITDPPYRTTPRGIGKRTNTGGMLRSELTCKGKIFKHNELEPEEYIPDLYRVLKDGSHCYIMSNHLNLKAMLDVAIDCGFKFVRSLIWDKVNKGPGHSYMSQFEYILFFRKGRFKKINNCGTSDIITVPNKKTMVIDKDENGNPKLHASGKPKKVPLHPTEKPVELAETLVLNSSNEYDVSFDPFSGLGFVLKASKKHNRFFIGNEIDPIYWDLCVEGLEQY